MYLIVTKVRQDIFKIHIMTKAPLHGTICVVEMFGLCNVGRASSVLGNTNEI